MAPRPLSPLVLALGGAAAVLGSVLFILWKAYFGRGRERRWDRGEGWWGVEPARLPDWDEWDVSVGLVRLPASDGRARFQGLELPPAGPARAAGPLWAAEPRNRWRFGEGAGGGRRFLPELCRGRTRCSRRPPSACAVRSSGDVARGPMALQ